jgi:arginine repressor
MPRPKKAAARKAEQPSRAEIIRQTARTLGKRVRPRDIIAALKEKGVEVSSALVSKTLAAAGFRRRRRGRKANASAAATKSTGQGLNLDALIAAKALIEKVGGFENAKAALSALKKLQ